MKDQNAQAWFKRNGEFPHRRSNREWTDEPELKPLGRRRANCLRARGSKS